MLTLTACAALPPGPRDPRDRFERYNRSMFAFNNTVDRAVARPVARAYVAVTPRPVRAGISNFLANLEYPTTIVNSLLQGKFVATARGTGRLVINTTLGLGGLFDPATRIGLQAKKEDFGQTLGYWGVHPGPYIVLPLLGPTDVRDGLGSVADQYSSPRTYLNDDTVRYGLIGLDLVDTRAALLDADNLIERSYDPYVFVRNGYLDRREYLVKDGDVDTTQQYEEPEDINAPAETPAAAPAPAPQR
jgi:phospholipid-binding lipoprotein MlaA